MDNSTVYDPQEVSVSYLLPDGSVTEAPFGAIDTFMTLCLKYGIVHGVAIGSCGILAITFLVFNYRRRNTPMFWFCQATLLTRIIYSALLLVYFLGPLSSIAVTFTGRVLPSTFSAYQTSVAANAFRVINVVCIETLMVFQTYVVFRSPEVRRWGYGLAAMLGVLSAATVGFYINSAVIASRNSHLLYKIGYSNQTENRSQNWESNLPVILYSASINVMSLVLVAKLVFAVRTRRYLGLKQFDSYHILAIMGTQTMVVPAILVIFNYTVYISTAILSEVAGLLVVLSLPLSSMWAMAANNLSNVNNTTIFGRQHSRATSEPNLATTEYSFLPWKLDKYVSNKSTPSAFSQATAVLQSEHPYSARDKPHDIERIFADDDSVLVGDKGSLRDVVEARDRHLAQYTNNRIVKTEVHDFKY